MAGIPEGATNGLETTAQKFRQGIQLIHTFLRKDNAGGKSMPMLFYQALQTVFASFRDYRQEEKGNDYSERIFLPYKEGRNTAPIEISSVCFKERNQKLLFYAESLSGRALLSAR